MNKNLPTEIWDMILVERKKVFRKRVEEFEEKFEYSVGWKPHYRNRNGYWSTKNLCYRYP